MWICRAACSYSQGLNLFTNTHSNTTPALLPACIQHTFLLLRTWVKFAMCGLICRPAHAFATHIEYSYAVNFHRRSFQAFVHASREHHMSVEDISCVCVAHNIQGCLLTFTRTTQTHKHICAKKVVQHLSTCVHAYTLILVHTCLHARTYIWVILMFSAQ
jgi:hypothetical protein